MWRPRPMQELTSPQPVATSSVVSRIATGSCTAYDIRDQPVWQQVSDPRRPPTVQAAARPECFLQFVVEYVIIEHAPEGEVSTHAEYRMALLGVEHVGLLHALTPVDLSAASQIKC